MKFLFNKSNLFIGVILFALIPLLIPHKLFWLHIIIMFMVYASLGQALNILSGYSGQLSLGHSAFFGIGAYTSTLLSTNFGILPWFGMIIGGILATILSIGIGYPCFRLRGPFFVLSTIALAEIVRMLALYFKGLTKGAIGVPIPLEFGLKHFVFRGKVPYFYIALIILVAITLISWLISRSKFGSGLTALREDEDTALTVGINVKWFKLKAMMISAFLTAILGTFHAQYVLFIEPGAEFSLSLSMLIAMIVILGGYGNVWGAIVGAAILIPLQEFMRNWFGGGYQGLHFVIYGIIGMIIAIFIPEGIVGRSSKVFKNIRPKEKIIFEPSTVLMPKFDGQADLLEDSYLLSLKDLRKSFGGIAAVKGVNIDVKEKGITSIIGPNGAGKSTIFNLISGLYKPDNGKIIFLGEDITHLPSYQRSIKGIGRTFQIVKPFYGISVLDNVVVGGFSQIRATPRQVKIQAMDILHFTGLFDKRDFRISELTTGDQKRLELSRALAGKPRLILLDEIMSALNPKETQDMVSTLRQIQHFGVTILLIEHVMNVVMQLSDKVIVIDQGEKIAEGSPSDIAKNEKTIKAYLGRSYGTTA